MAAPVDPRSWAEPRPRGLPRWVPIVGWLPSYDRGWLRMDVVAGATIWGLLVPEMIAYAGLAGLPPQAGLYTLLIAPLAYAVLGTSRQLVAAGTSAAAVLLASSVIDLARNGTADYVTTSAALVLICGCVLLAAGVLRLGFVAQFLSRPVVDGFVFGLALFVTVKQLPKLFGIEGGDGNTVSQLVHVIAHLGDTSGLTLLVGVAGLAVLFGGERYVPRLPGGLVVLGLGIAVSAAFDLSGHGVAVVGTVPGGLPTPSVPDIHRADLPTLLAAAGGMALVMFSESLGAAENFARKHGYAIDPDQELIALGACNLGSGLVGGLAAGGSLSQTAVNESAGARSQVSPLVATLLSLVTILVLTPLFTDLPEAMLAALIIHAVFHLWKIAEFRRYRILRRVEFWLGLLTLAGVIVLDVLPGLAIGVVSMLMLLIYQASRPRVGEVGQMPGDPDAFLNVRRHADAREVPGVLVLRIYGPVVYTNAAMVTGRVKELVGGAAATPSAVVLDISATDRLDVTSAEALDDLARALQSAGIALALAEVRTPVAETAQRAGLIQEIGEGHVYPTIRDAVDDLARADPG